MIKDCQSCKPKEGWLVPQYGIDTVVCDICGTTSPLTPAIFVCDLPKYKGSTIDEITDEWYLNFLLKVAVEKEDWVLERCVTLKLSK